MTTPTAESLLALERELEADIIECQRLLESGLNDVLKQLDAVCEKAGKPEEATAAGRLKKMTEESNRHVKSVQKSLGELNLALHQFVLTDSSTIENVAAFDVWRNRVLADLHSAGEAIGQIQLEGEIGWNLALIDVWRNFRHQLEVVREHMTMDEQHAEEELDAERLRLAQRVNELRDGIRRNPHQVRDWLRRRGSTHEEVGDAPSLAGWGKALLMWKDKPVPEEVRQQAVHA